MTEARTFSVTLHAELPLSDLERRCFAYLFQTQSEMIATNEVDLAQWLNETMSVNRFDPSEDDLEVWGTRTQYTPDPLVTFKVPFTPVLYVWSEEGDSFCIGFDTANPAEILINI